MDQRTLLTYRCAIGLAQAIVLFLLYKAAETKVWPATDGYVFAPLLTIFFFVPLKAISGLGNMRLRTLLIWLAGATVLCGALAVYDIFGLPNLPLITPPQPRITPTPSMVLSLAAILFIGHTLIVAGEADRRWVATYPTYFDLSWKHGVQAVLAILFLGVFWGILFLGASLFAVIKITLIMALITRPLFWITVTAVSFAYALHLTDVRAGIVRGTRTLVLVLLSWLLPVMTLLVVGFILALPFTGLDVLWNTRRATSLLLTSAAVLIFLINAAYQDGKDQVPALLRYCRLAASVALVPLVALAGYGLMLRVSQYGWSPQRVTALACIVVAACYAAGYGYAAIRSGLSLQRLERTNVLTAFAVIGVLVLLLTPIADPIRVSVISQVGRLQSGQTAPDKFDYHFLRYRSGRYGAEALQSLAAATAASPAVAERAKQALDTTNPAPGRRPPAPPPSLEKRMANITVVQPKDAAFPSSFLEQDWTTYSRQWMLPRCMIGDIKCEAVLLDLDDDGKDEILLFTVPNGASAAFKWQQDKWGYLGSLHNINCVGVRAAIRTGQINTLASKLKDIEVGGQRLQVNSECVTAVR